MALVSANEFRIRKTFFLFCDSFKEPAGFWGEHQHTIEFRNIRVDHQTRGVKPPGFNADHQTATVGLHNPKTISSPVEKAK